MPPRCFPKIPRCGDRYPVGQSQQLTALNVEQERTAALSKRERDGELVGLLRASADYLEDIASTSMTGAGAALQQWRVVGLSGFAADTLVAPLEKIYRPICRNHGLTLSMPRTDRTLCSRF